MTAIAHQEAQRVAQAHFPERRSLPVSRVPPGCDPYPCGSRGFLLRLAARGERPAITTGCSPGTKGAVSARSRHGKAAITRSVARSAKRIFSWCTDVTANAIMIANGYAPMYDCISTASSNSPIRHPRPMAAKPAVAHGCSTRTGRLSEISAASSSNWIRDTMPMMFCDS